MIHKKLINKIIVLALAWCALISLSCNVFAQQINPRKLPNCPQDWNEKWNSCCGTQKFINGTYEGEFKNGLYEGYVIFQLDSGEIYVGEFKNQLKNGKGSNQYPNGDKYEGEWRNGNRHGQGKYTFLDGETYVGEFQYNQRQGLGSLTRSSGSKYVGQFKNDKANGQGTFTNFNGDRYTGEFKDGKADGQGTYIFSNGDKYIGEFKDNYRNGKGKLIFADGVVQDGIWRKDEFVITNNLALQSDNSVPIQRSRQRNISIGISDGRSSYPKCEGKKVDEWTNCIGYMSTATYDYRGEFLNGKPDGVGIHYYKSGARYYGGFFEGKYSGLGIFLYQNGDVYEGEWKNGYRHGLGRHSSSAIPQREGIWEIDKFIRVEKISNLEVDFSGYVLINHAQNTENLPSCPRPDFSRKTDIERIANWNRCWGFYKYQDHKNRKGDYFEGEWDSGQPNGQGVYFFANGDRYEGALVDGLRDGYGYHSFSKGMYYSGEWKKDKYHGVGMSVYPGGDYYFGE